MANEGRENHELKRGDEGQPQNNVEPKGRRDRRLEQRKDTKEEPEEVQKLHERVGTRNIAGKNHKPNQTAPKETRHNPWG